MAKVRKLWLFHHGVDGVDAYSMHLRKPIIQQREVRSLKTGEMTTLWWTPDEMLFNFCADGVNRLGFGLPLGGLSQIGFSTVDD